MKIRNVLASAAMALFVLAPSLALSHHSFSAEFDSSRTVHLEGTVTQYRWVNPHSWIHISVPKSDGTKEEWRIEGGAPSLLLRRGWTRDSLPVGTKIIVNAFPARDGDRRASPRDISFPDGRKIDFGGSYDPNEDKKKN